MLKSYNNTLKLGKAIAELLSPILPVYAVIADHGATYPCAVYKRTGLIPKPSKDFYNTVEESNIEIYIAAIDYQESIDLALKVKDILEYRNKSVGVFPILNCQLIDASEDWKDDAFIQILTFRFQVAKAANNND